MSPSPRPLQGQDGREEDGQPARVLAGWRGWVPMVWSVTRTESDPVKATETRPGHRLTLNDLGIHHRNGGLSEGGYVTERQVFLKCVTVPLLI